MDIQSFIKNIKNPVPIDEPDESICKHCGGTGWEVNIIDDKSVVNRCDCYLEQKRQDLYKDAKIPKKFRHCRLDNFTVHEGYGKNKKLNHHLSGSCQLAKTFVRKYPNLSKGLFFMGNCGAGKTHLAVAIISELTLCKGIPCLFYDFRDLLKDIRFSYDPNSPISEFSVLEPVITKEILVLDDLGAWKISDWVRDIVNYIINKRYNDSLITIITSNWMDNPKKKDEETLADRIGVRLRSRLHEMCQEMEIEAQDYREQTKKCKI